MINVEKTIVTRVGISPFSSEQHIGVYRSFLVSVFVAQFSKGKTFLRIDDTNPLHTANIDKMIDDMTSLISPQFFYDFSEHEVGATKVGANFVPAIIESRRQSIYHKYLDILKDRGFLFDKEDALYFDARKYIDLYGSNINVPYQGKANRIVSIEKVMPNLCFPILVNSGHRFLWHFTSTVDDELLKVTHIVRAKDKIDNQVPQTMLNNVLGFSTPEYLYTKIITSHQKLPSINDIVTTGVSLDAIRSYLYGTITGKSEKLYLSFSDALEDFSPELVTPGQIFYDYKKLLSIQKRLSKLHKPLS